MGEAPKGFEPETDQNATDQTTPATETDEAHQAVERSGDLNEEVPPTPGIDDETSEGQDESTDSEGGSEDFPDDTQEASEEEGAQEAESASESEPESSDESPSEEKSE